MWVFIYSFFFMVFNFLVFFFSSRRRHTRSTRDWSSDVCSSDLEVSEDLVTRFGLFGRNVAGAIEVLNSQRAVGILARLRRAEVPFADDERSIFRPEEAGSEGALRKLPERRHGDKVRQLGHRVAEFF